MATIVDELITVIGYKLDKGSADRVNRSADATRERMQALRTSAKRVGIALVGAFTVAAGAAAKLTTSFANTADQFAKDSKRLGIGIEALQELKFAAGLAGSEFGTVKTGFQRLAAGLIDATAKGTGPAADAFAELGISLDDPAVKGRDLEGVLDLVSDKFKGMPDGATKTAAAMKLFGKSGAELIPLLNEGSDGIGRMRQEARDLGGVIGTDAAKAAEEFNDNVSRTKFALEGVRNEIAVALLPVFKKVIDRILRWTKANKDLIATRLREFFEGLVSVVRTLLPIVQSLLENWRALAAFFIAGKLLAGINAISGALGGIGAAASLSKGAILGLSAAISGAIALAQQLDDARTRTTRVDRGPVGFADSALTAEETNTRTQARSLVLEAQRRVEDSGTRANPADIQALENAQRGLASIEKTLQDRSARRRNEAQRQFDAEQRAKETAARDKAIAESGRVPPSRGGGGRRRKSVDDLINGASGSAAGRIAATPQVALTVNRFDMPVTVDIAVTGVPGTTAREVASTIDQKFDTIFGAKIRKAAEALRTREAR